MNIGRALEMRNPRDGSVAGYYFPDVRFGSLVASPERKDREHPASSDNENPAVPVNHEGAT